MRLSGQKWSNEGSKAGSPEVSAPAGHARAGTCRGHNALPLLRPLLRPLRAPGAAHGLGESRGSGGGSGGVPVTDTPIATPAPQEPPNP